MDSSDSRPPPTGPMKWRRLQLTDASTSRPSGHRNWRQSGTPGNKPTDASTSRAAPDPPMARNSTRSREAAQTKSNAPNHHPPLSGYRNPRPPLVQFHPAIAFHHDSFPPLPKQPAKLPQHYTATPGLKISQDPSCPLLYICFDHGPHPQFVEWQILFTARQVRLLFRRRHGQIFEASDVVTVPSGWDMNDVEVLDNGVKDGVGMLVFGKGSSEEWKELIGEIEDFRGRWQEIDDKDEEMEIDEWKFQLNPAHE
ncbi:hypothetical protein RUND412_009286 [Rhizina undulata]